MMLHCVRARTTNDAVREAIDILRRDCPLHETAGFEMFTDDLTEPTLDHLEAFVRQCTENKLLPATTKKGDELHDDLVHLIGPCVLAASCLDPDSDIKGFVRKVATCDQSHVDELVERVVAAVAKTRASLAKKGFEPVSVPYRMFLCVWVVALKTENFPFLF